LFKLKKEIVLPLIIICLYLETNNKVTTPPPSRKNSTSNMFSHNISLSSQNSNNLQTYMSNPANINRSPSYECQSRNKIDITCSILQQQHQYLTTNEGYNK
jgi:hypothetical protein